MSTTIRITDEDKHRLHRVQRRLTDLTGSNVTMQDLVGLMVRHAEQDPTHLVRRPARRRTREEMERMRQEIDAMGGWTGSWEDIDAIVYDEP